MPAAFGHAKGGGSKSMKPARDVPKFQQTQSATTHTIMNTINDSYKREAAAHDARKQERLRTYWDFELVPLGGGAPLTPARYRRRAHLVVNTASRCGFAPQLRELQALWARYPGLAVLAFPCDQFGGQEPGSAGDIRDAYDRYGVDFPVFEKSDVNGPRAHPLFTYLKKATAGQPVPNKGLPRDEVQWNFTKWLIVDGEVLRRYSFDASPKSVLADVVYTLKLKEVIEEAPPARPVEVEKPAIVPKPAVVPRPEAPPPPADEPAAVVLHHARMTVKLQLTAKLRRDGTVALLKKQFAKAWNKDPSRPPLARDAVAFRKAGEVLDGAAPLATAIADGDVLEALVS